MSDQPKLIRTFGLFTLVVYGVGDILGAGIYALLGEVVGVTGEWAWLAFSFAMVVALMTAFCYAELTSRFPHSGGCSYYVFQATRSFRFSFLAGWILIGVSFVSMATLSRAFVGYVERIGVDAPDWLVLFIFLAGISFINLWGIGKSSAANVVSTLIEVLGLAVVVAAALYALAPVQSASQEVVVSSELSTVGWTAIIQGAALAFYAFVGFEDLANVAEEVKNPEKNLPVAILLAIVISGFLYIVIAYLATAVVEPTELARSKGPLTEVVERSGIGFPIHLFSVVALFAVANTCLLNSITASRQLYGLSKLQIVPRFFGRVHSRFKTPHIAILGSFPVVFLLAHFGSLKFLAGSTSFLILILFCSTNLSLLLIKKQVSNFKGFRSPRFVAVAALFLNFSLMLFSQKKSIVFGISFLFLGFLVSLLIRSDSEAGHPDRAAIP